MNPEERPIRSRGADHAVEDRAMDQLTRMVRLTAEVIGDGLVGAYLHGDADETWSDELTAQVGPHFDAVLAQIRRLRGPLGMEG